MDELVRSGVVDLIVVDSVSALVPRSEVEGDIGTPQVRTVRQAAAAAGSNKDSPTNATATTTTTTNNRTTKAKAWQALQGGCRAVVWVLLL